MKRILIILIISFVFATVQAQMDNPLKKGMPNTVTLSTGGVVYDLNGEWNEVLEVTSTVQADAGKGQTVSSKDVIKITQGGNKFVGIRLNGNRWVEKNKEALQGELKRDRFKVIYTFVNNHYRWVPGKGEIREDGNKILLESKPPYLTYTVILTRK